MTLFVDTQHGPGHSGDLGPLLRRYLVPSSLVVDQRLDHGDILIIGNGPNGSALRIGIEVKRIGDVLACMDDGRLAGLDGQLEGMHRDYDLSWLVVEDELRPDRDSGVLMKRLTSVRLQRGARGRKKRSKTEGARVRDRVRVPTSDGRFVPALYGSSRTVTYATVMKWLTSLQAGSIYKYGKPLFVWSTRTPDETAQWIVSQYRFWTDKKFEAHKSMQLFNTALHEKGRRSVGFMSEARKRRMMFVNLFDGMGYDRAANVSTKFSSIEDMARATVEELQVKGSGRGKKDGVGEKVARKMYEQIREKRR